MPVLPRIEHVQAGMTQLLNDWTNEQLDQAQTFLHDMQGAEGSTDEFELAGASSLFKGLTWLNAGVNCLKTFFGAGTVIGTALASPHVAIPMYILTQASNAFQDYLQNHTQEMQRQVRSTFASVYNRFRASVYVGRNRANSCPPMSRLRDRVLGAVQGDLAFFDATAGETFFWNVFRSMGIVEIDPAAIATRTHDNFGSMVNTLRTFYANTHHGELMDTRMIMYSDAPRNFPSFVQARASLRAAPLYAPGSSPYHSDPNRQPALASLPQSEAYDAAYHLGWIAQNPRAVPLNVYAPGWRFAGDTVEDFILRHIHEMEKQYLNYYGVRYTRVLGVRRLGATDRALVRIPLPQFTDTEIWRALNDVRDNVPADVGGGPRWWNPRTDPGAWVYD